jgi:hypothetical protein
MFRSLNEAGASRVRWLAMTGALALLFTGCEGTLEVTEREFLTPAGTNVDLLYAGAIRDFNQAYSGGGLDDRILANEALLTDQLFSSGTFTTRTATDQRDQFSMVQGNTSDAGYVELHQARRAALRTLEAMAAEGETSGDRVSQMKLLEGFSYIGLGENYCSGIPFSDVTPEGELVAGNPISTQQIFEAAITIFDAAVAADGSNDAARVGKARALVNLGRYSEAAGVVSGVPTSYIRVIEHSDNSGDQENPIFNLQSNGRYSLSDLEGGNGLPYRSDGDPRIPWVEDPLGGFDAGIRLFIVQKYDTRSAPMVLADGIEARLIEAEADLNTGGTNWLTILNDLRSQVATLMPARIIGYSSKVPGPNNPTTTLAPLTDPGTFDSQLDMIMAERAYWMFITAHRLGDMRRLVRDYGRSQADVFPSGPYFKGGTYGDDVNLPLEFDETNNSNYDEALCVFENP